MIIDKTNASIIDKEVYIHDDILLDMSFNRIDKQLTLKFEKYASDKKTYFIKFFGVIGFSMSSADFWGASECVLDFENVPNAEKNLIPEILKKHIETDGLFKNISYDNFIETLFTFGSGDLLRIACETIEIM